MEIYRDHINMFLSKLGYSELVQRLFEKMTFFAIQIFPAFHRMFHPNFLVARRNRYSEVGAAMENFPARKRKKSFGSTYARKIEAKTMSQRTIRATPKIGDFHFQRWWPIST